LLTLFVIDLFDIQITFGNGLVVVLNVDSIDLRQYPSISFLPSELLRDMLCFFAKSVAAFNPFSKQG
jgi:hypothetical protein